MPRHNDLDLDLYRLTVRDAELLLPFMGERIRNDEQIVEVLKAACDGHADYHQETSKANYIWGLRNFTELPSEVYPRAKVFAVALAKATKDRDGVVFMPQTLEVGTSVAAPPTAEVAMLVFQMTRHLVAVEYKSTVTYGQGWLRALHEVLRRAADQLHFTSTLQLQAKPTKFEILKSFRSFDTLTRLRVQLLLPNPDLSRLTKNLYEELRKGGIREYLADMRNPSGLSKEEQTLPHAAAAMAEDGYKKGEVLLEGIRQGRRETVRTGTRPARMKMDGIKNFVRGLSATARTKEGQNITDSILKEIDRVADADEENELAHET